MGNLDFPNLKKTIITDAIKALGVDRNHVPPYFELLIRFGQFRSVKRRAEVMAGVGGEIEGKAV